MFYSYHAFAAYSFDGYHKAGVPALQLDSDEGLNSVNSIFLNFCDKAYNSHQKSIDFVRAKLFSDVEPIENEGGVGFKINNYRASDLIYDYDPPLSNERELLALPSINLLVIEKEESGDVIFECAAIISVGFPTRVDREKGIMIPADSLFVKIRSDFDGLFWMDEDMKSASKDGRFRKWNTHSLFEKESGELMIELMRPVLILKYKQTAKKVR